ncbi:MAG TPA: 50S ribosomal protein L6 [Candidatus Nanoarchaeia archaeon]|nr:50S ribosomal protein L6 [Candidatus Nanoarchaeia archaeon]
MKQDLIEEIELTSGVSAQLEKGILKISGQQGQVERKIFNPKVEVEIRSDKIILKSLKATKREKKIVGAFYAHIKNMVKGVTENFVYKLKICSGHFPMSVSVSGNEFTIKNFLGESVPRKVALIRGSEVKIEGDFITVTSADKEIAGQNAAKIESLCRITNRDRRIFQDGCYIIDKAGKEI